jgi:site-specific DNA-methyltransferase (adenine-specific)
MRQENNFRIYHGDCIEVMSAHVGSASVDMILTDLPYGITQNRKDIPVPFDGLWEQYMRIIKPNGAILLFAASTFYIDLVNSNRKYFRYDIIWDKVLVSGFLSSHRMPMRRHEQIAVFYKKLPTYNPQFTEGAPLHSQGVRALGNSYVKNSNYGNFRTTGDERQGSTQKYPTSIIRFSKVHPSKSSHPTEKSIPMLEYLIKMYTNPGEHVLDSCMGSGTCGIAALNTQRIFTGIEIDESYFNLASARISSR